MQTVTQASQAPASKRDVYLQICQQLDALLTGETDIIANAANTAALLANSLPDINWAGFYFLRGEELVLGPFQGKPACVRIALGKGVCGKAAETAETIVVRDVSQFPGHIACDPASQSEIVAPLVSWGKVLGVLDIDSASVGRFDDEDREGVESVIAVFLEALAGSDWPDLLDESRDLEDA
ncbi:MAG TPA: GAF domain-containing protein [Bryobacteraceae bacterium]|jgi:GAF domain-containing protein|nr:GAF domain-containing protein [Bryobacteraceae bacterium]